MPAHKTTVRGSQYYEDYYRLTTRDLPVAVTYLSEIVREVEAAGIPWSRITVRAELDAAPYSIEIEVLATPQEAATLGWTLAPDDEEAAA